jgi:hypothetical protein
MKWKEILVPGVSFSLMLSAIGRVFPMRKFSTKKPLHTRDACSGNIHRRKGSSFYTNRRGVSNRFTSHLLL